MKRLALLMVLCLLHPCGVSAGSPDFSGTGFYYLSPVPGAEMVRAHTNLIFRPTARLSHEMPEWTSHVEVTGQSSGTHTGHWVHARDGRTFIFEPQQPFQPGEVVTVRLRSGERGAIGLRDASYTFTVSSYSAAPPKPNLEDLLAELAIPTPLPGRVSEKHGPGTPPADYDLPLDFPQANVTWVDDPSPGQVFVAAYSVGGGSASTTYLMILNDAGLPSFFRGRRNDFFFDFKKQLDGRLSYFDFKAGKYYFLDKSYAVVDSAHCYGYPADIHDVQVLPGGDILIMGIDYHVVDMSAIVEGGNPHALVLGLIIQEQDADRNVVFQWRSWDYIDILDVDHVNLTTHRIDYVHANSVDLDNDGNIIVSCRHVSTVLKIDSDTGDVVWRLGGKHNDFTLVGDDQWFSRQHSVRRLPNGDITVFNNGNYNDPTVSRAMEYRLDEVNKTATLVWSFTHDPALFASAMGNVQRLADGNTMVGWGNTNPNVTEVRPDGSTAFEMTYPQGVFTYRAFRDDWDGAARAPFLWSITGDEDLKLDFTWFGVDGVTGYDVYRSDAGGPFAPAGHSDGNRFAVHGFPAGETLRFKVKAITRDGEESPFSNMIYVTPAFDDVIITASLEIHPRTLNLQSKGQWIDARVELPGDCDCEPADVDVSSIRLNGTVPAVADKAKVATSGLGVTMSLKFDRTAVAGALEGERGADVEVTGEVGTRGFAGYDHIRVLRSEGGGPGVSARGDAPAATNALLGGVPNPFNPTTRIRYSVSSADAAVEIRVFDVAGRLVRTLVDARQTAGVHSVVWDGRDERGRHVPSGVYFCRMRSADYSQTRKIVLMK